jgi:hypothetical protein
MPIKKFPSSATQSIGFIIYESANYNPAKPVKGILFAHGIGQRGDGSTTNISGWMLNEGTEICKLVDSGNFVLIAPELLFNQNWTTNYFDFVYSYITTYYPVDPKVFLSGVSLGGQELWAWAAANSAKVEAILACCCVNISVDFCAIKPPVVAFHAKNDPVVPFAEGMIAINKIQACGGNAKMIALDLNIHEIWRSNVFLSFDAKALLSVSNVIPTSTTLKADASATAAMASGSTAILDGSKSTGFSYLSWQMTGQPNGSDWNVFPGFTKIGPKINLKNLVAGDYVFELTAWDNTGKIAKDTVKITVSTTPKIFVQATIPTSASRVTVYDDKSIVFE